MNDLPSLRGYDWKRRSDQILERDGECRRCGDSNDNYEGRSPVGLSAHHIVPGRELPKEDARIDLNLVAVCSRCHQRLDETKPRNQFAAVGFDVSADIIESLESTGPMRQADLLHDLDHAHSEIENRLLKMERLELIDLRSDGLVELALRLDSEKRDKLSRIERRQIAGDADE